MINSNNVDMGYIKRGSCNGMATLCAMNQKPVLALSRLWA